MTERPIIMQAESIRAILAGRKTETRRVVKPQPEPIPGRVQRRSPYDDTGHWWASSKAQSMVSMYDAPSFCPYGKPGDLLHVGETLVRIDDGNGYPYAVYERDNTAVLDGDGIPVRWRWKVRKLTSMYCPKDYRRIWLRVTEVAVERVQDITTKAALAEGVAYDVSKPNGGPVSGFAALWDTINAKRGYPWAESPWVWVVRFEVVSTTGRPANVEPATP